MQRVGLHHIKLYGLRMGCHSISYACEGRQANTFGNMVHLFFIIRPLNTMGAAAQRIETIFHKQFKGIIIHLILLCLKVRAVRQLKKKKKIQHFSSFSFLASNRPNIPISSLDDQSDSFFSCHFWHWKPVRRFEYSKLKANPTSQYSTPLWAVLFKHRGLCLVQHYECKYSDTH